jgi:hypothetical protein
MLQLLKLPEHLIYLSQYRLTVNLGTIELDSKRQCPCGNNLFKLFLEHWIFKGLGISTAIIATD